MHRCARFSRFFFNDQNSAPFCAFTVSSAAVYALLLPPCADKYLLFSFSSGYFSVPMKSMCSKKCAMPYGAPGCNKISVYKSFSPFLLKI